MKKIIIAFMLLVTTAVNTSFAAGTEPVNGKVLQSFNSEFTTASNISWSKLSMDGLYRATFNYNEEKLDAFFNEEGELVATSRFIDKKLLPIAIQKELSKEYNGFIIRTTIIECSTDEETAYYITADSPKVTVVLKASGRGHLSVFKKHKR